MGEGVSAFIMESIILCDGDWFQWKGGQIRTGSFVRYICEIIFEAKGERLFARADANWFPI